MESKAPIDCTFKELCQIERDNFDAGDFWIVTDSDDVTIAKQQPGEVSTESVTVPVKIFRRLLKFVSADLLRVASDWMGDDWRADVLRGLVT